MEEGELDMTNEVHEEGEGGGRNGRYITLPCRRTLRNIRLPFEERSSSKRRRDQCVSVVPTCRTLKQVHFENSKARGLLLGLDELVNRPIRVGDIVEKELSGRAGSR